MPILAPMGLRFPSNLHTHFQPVKTHQQGLICQLEKLLLWQLMNHMTRLKRGRPLGSKDLIYRKRKIKGQQNPSLEEKNTPEEATPTISKIITPEEERTIEVTHAPEEAIVPEETQNHEDAQVLINDEISLNYASTEELWDRTKVVINEVFCFAVATKILKEDEDHEQRSVDECCSKHDWSKWKEAI